MYDLQFHLLLFAFFAMNTHAAPSKGDGSAPFKVDRLVTASGVVWGLDFVSEKMALYTTREGEIFRLDLDSRKIQKLTKMEDLLVEGQGGLLDLRVKKIDGKIFVYVTASVVDPKKEKTGATTQLARYEWNGERLKNFTVLLTTDAWSENQIHFGSRIAFKDKFLFLSVGDRNEREKAQDLSFHNGKILRLNLDGSVPQDNPYVGNKKARPEIWSFGHRNPQGLATHPVSGDLWSSEFGPLGGDEINLILPQKNYGWPIVTYGREYSGGKIGEGFDKKGMQAPVVHYVPSISPSGIDFYNGESFAAWKNALFVANLSSQHLRLLEITKNTVVHQKELLKDEGLRFRTVRMGPDGFMYFSTDSGLIGRLVRPQAKKN